MNNIIKDNFAKIVGDEFLLQESSIMERFLQEQRGRYSGKAAFILQPSTVSQVSQIMRLAYQYKIPVVPQGGNTGLVGGGQPNSEHAIILSLSRLKNVRSVDYFGQVIEVEAGIILDQLQNYLQEKDYFFPMHLASSGSCQIGGLLSTNAGGVHVLAHGSMRHLCLGIEVVLPDGEILSDLRWVIKDNSGYDLKNLFIGAEGTLGIITAASLKILPQPQSKFVAFMGVQSLDAVQQLFALARQGCGNMLNAFELLPDLGLDFVLKSDSTLQNPLQEKFPWYVLIELAGSVPQAILQDVFEDFMQKSIDKHLVEDAIVAQNKKQADLFWQLRERMSDAQKPEGVSIKHDISVPLKVLPQFIQQAEDLIYKIVPNSRIVCFGHVGDGNLHYDILQPIGSDAQLFMKHSHEIEDAIHALAQNMGGSFSAEHGIGQIKTHTLEQWKNPTAYYLMKKIKKMIDPNNIMNPGKVFY